MAVRQSQGDSSRGRFSDILYHPVIDLRFLLCSIQAPCNNYTIVFQKISSGIFVVKTRGLSKGHDLRKNRNSMAF